MKIYYCEYVQSQNGWECEANDDKEAVEKCAAHFPGDKLLCVYTESDTPDGTSFRMIVNNSKNY